MRSMEKQFLSSGKSSVYNYLSEDKIELLVCNTGSQNCKEHLLIINKCYIESNNYHFESDYNKSIESLKDAFLRTCDLHEDSCVKCAEFFRSTITKSLENINSELYKLTSGFISNNRYLKSYEKSCAVLNEFKKEL